MWLASGSNRYGACASLLVAHLHCYIILAIRQYPKVVGNSSLPTSYETGMVRHHKGRLLELSFELCLRRAE